MSETTRNAGPMTFNLVIVVWGDAYIDCLNQIALPSLAPSMDELKYVRKQRWRFLVYTKRCHINTIQTTIDRFFPFAEQFYYEIAPESYDNHYLAMAHAHHHAAELCVRDHTKAIIVAPDAVFSKGALAYVVSVAASGKRAIMAVGPRFSQERSFHDIRNMLARQGSINSRTLAALLMQYRHHEMMRYDWDSKDFSSEPYLLLWTIPDGWLIRSFHYHPLMIDFSSSNALSTLQGDTIDGDFIGSFIGNWDHIHVVQDSDQLFVCTLTPDKTFYSNSNAENASIEFMRRFAYNNPLINSFHRWLITKSVKIHASELDDNWAALEDHTGNIVFQFLLTRPFQIKLATGLPNIELMTQSCTDEVRRIKWAPFKFLKKYV